MAASSAVVLTWVVAVFIFSSSTNAYDFYVGGRDGWVVNPSQTFNRWAESNRFQVNDKLVFNYNKGEDSVLLVTKKDYDSCNTSNPIRRMDQGESVFLLDRPGHFFFISGAPGRCEKGQRMVVAVMAARSGRTAPSPLSVSPSLPPPLLSPVSASPSLPPSMSASAPSPHGYVVGSDFASAPTPAPSTAETGSATSSYRTESVLKVMVGLLVLGGVCFV